MLTREPTAENIANWKQVYSVYHDRLNPNRKTGAELQAYLLAHYPLQRHPGSHAKQTVIQNILQNEVFARELPQGSQPEPVCYSVRRSGTGKSLYAEQPAYIRIGRIFVGIDLATGYFCVEGSDRLWDELYAFRGLSESDRTNYYCVAEYIACLERFHLLEQVLNP